MILSLNKKNSLRSNSFLFLTLQSHNFLTLFLRGGRSYCAKNKDSIKNKSLLTVVRCPLTSPLPHFERDTNLVRRWYDCGRKMTTLSYILDHIFPTGYLYTFDIL